MDEYPTSWESVSDHSDFATYRLRVPGGWIVAVRDAVHDTTQVVFVANPDGSWKLES